MQLNHHFIKQLNRKNLCTWYILPLVDMNLHSFGEANIVNTFLVTGKMLIAVEVLDSNLCPDMRHHFAYQQTLNRADHELMVFEIPDRWTEDVQCFIKGSYSHMSEDAKNKIKEKSSLKYMVTDDKGVPYTDAILMALDKHPVLRETWINLLDSDKSTRYIGLPIELPEELLSIPSSECFIVI